jgi:glycosyltransferase involved in cell wall biosynthesis
MFEYTTNKKNNKSYKFTICTACYNSSKTIHAVYDSIEKLSYTDFEWIVINDASTDDTAEIIKNIISKSNIDISLFDLSENKMVTYCYNLAVSKSNSEFFILLDHDDEIVYNALDRFIYHWESTPISDRDALAGLISNCIDENGKLVGSLFPKSPYINGYFDAVFFDNVKGEKFFCYKTEIMKNNNFPLVDRYVPESVVMWNISSMYKTIFINESLRIYTTPGDGDENLSNLNSFEYNKGFRFKYLQLLNKHYRRILFNPRITLNFVFYYIVYSYYSKIPLKKNIADLDFYFHKVIALVLIPIFKIKKYWSRPDSKRQISLQNDSQ